MVIDEICVCIFFIFIPCVGESLLEKNYVWRHATPEPAASGKLAILRAAHFIQTILALVAGECAREKRRQEERHKRRAKSISETTIGLVRRQVKHLFTLALVHAARRPDGTFFYRGVLVDRERGEFCGPRRVFARLVAVFVEDFVGADDRRVVREKNRATENVVDSVATDRRRRAVLFEREFGADD